MFQFSVIIPVYNKWDLTRDCLQSLREHTPGNDFEVIVTDNASSDETQTRGKALGAALFADNFIYIRNDENRNFSGACNQGARAAGSDRLFFLNNDTLLTPRWAPPLLEALNNDSNLGAVGPLLLYPEQNLVQHLGAAFNPQGRIGHFYHLFPGRHPLALKRRKLNIITAAALMLRKKDFFAVGGFFEGYRNGFEDVELSYRLRQKGLTLSVIGESTIYHLASQSEGRNAHERFNGSLLCMRCPDILQPDLHIFATEDGYVPSLEADLSLCLGLSEQRETEMRRKLNSSDSAAASLALLDEEPLWDKGYQTLAESFFNQKDMLNLNYIVNRYVKFRPRVETFNWLARYARMTGHRDAIRLCADVIEQHKALLEDIKRISDMYYSIAESAEKYADTALRGLLKDWRKKHGAHYLVKNR